MDAMVQIITTVGFPIACCLIMGWYIKYLQDQHKDEISQLTEQHNSEVKELTDVVNGVKLVLQRLVDILDRKE